MRAWSVWKDTIIFLRPTQNEVDVYWINHPAAEREANKNTEETFCPDCLDFGVDRLQWNDNWCAGYSRESREIDKLFL